MPGGPGGLGGSGFGAIFGANTTQHVSSCTVALNVSTGGAGGVEGRPFNPGSFGPGAPGAALEMPQGILLNSLLAYNSPSNISGSVSDAGHNLSSDASYVLPGPGSASGPDPKLGPLTDNGGPTLTLALLPGSPAIDAGDTIAGPATDQRGVPRPYGLAADIGAFEYWLTAYARTASNSGVDILAYGIAGQTCWLQTSTNLMSWTTIATNQIGTDGTTLHPTTATEGPRRFYRWVLP